MIFKKIFKKRKLKLESYLVLISSTLVVFFLLAISTVLYAGSVKEINKKIADINGNMFSQIVTDIETELNQLDKICIYILENNRLKSYIAELENGDLDGYDEFMISRKIDNLLFNIKEYMSNIASINIVTAKAQYNGGNILFPYRLLDNFSKEVFEGISINYPLGSIQNTSIDEQNNKEGIFLDYYYLTFSLIDDNNIHFGNVYIFLDDIVANFKNSDYDIVILDDANNPLWSKNIYDDEKNSIIDHVKTSNTEEQRGLLSYSNKNIYYRKIAFRNWSILLIHEDNVLRTQIKLIRNLIFAGLILSVVIGIIFSKFVSGKILMPVNRLIRLMKSYMDKSSSKYIADKKSILTLRGRIFTYFIITILIPILIFTGIYYYQSGRIFREHIISSYSMIFNKTIVNLNEYFYKKLKIIQRISFDRNVQEYSIFNMEDDDRRDIIFEIFEESKYLGLDRDTISMFDLSENKLVISNRFDYQKSLNEVYFENIIGINTGIIWDVSEDELKRNLISMGMHLFQTEGSAFIKLDIDSVYLTELYLDTIRDNVEVFLVDKNNRMFSYVGVGNAHDGEQYPFYGMSYFEKANISGDEYIIFGEKLKSTPFYFIMKCGYKDVLNESSVIFLNSIYIYIILLLLILGLSYFITYKLLKPVNALNRSFVEMGSNEINEKFDESYFIEDIDSLGMAFNDMTRRIEGLIDELITSNTKKNKLINEKKNAEIKSLQAQINPHFLYNTLETINYMIKEGEKSKSVTMINALSDLFRYGISRKELLICVEEEIKYAQAYVEIMNTRYDNKIVFEWDISENILKSKVIKLILQPVIENAIHHGVSKNSGIKKIKIICAGEDDLLVFSVEDNGTGMSEHELEKVRNNILLCDTSNNIGIYNVQARINLYYGLEYGVDIQSQKGIGTIVTIKIPKHF